MSSTAGTYADALRRIGGPDALNALPESDRTLAARPRINAHVHLPPNFSAFETTRQALNLSQEQGVSILGGSNYYDYTVYQEFADGAAGRGIFPLFGLEIISLIDDLVEKKIRVNDPGNYGKMYLCGKAITRFAPMNEEAARLLQTIRDNDSARMAGITEKLDAVIRAAGVESGLDAEAIKKRVVARHGCPLETVYLQERHVAQAFQEVLFEKVAAADRPAFFEKLFGTPSKNPDDTVTIQNEIRTHLLKVGKPAFLPDTFVDFDHAYRLILALGGVPSYPTLADGASPICEYEQDTNALVADLKARNIHAAELIPIRNTPEVLRTYVRAFRDAGLIVTAGTEHNTRDLLPIEPTCVKDAPIPDDLKDIFFEGSCVLAAHQYLTARGLPGFVDAQGNANPDYTDAESRIAAFRRLGEAVLAQYQTVTG